MKRGHGEGSRPIQRKDGRWVAAVTLGWEDGKRVRKFVYGHSFKEAADRRDELLRQEPTPAAPTPPTSREYLSGWIDAVVPTLGPQTVPSYRNIVEGHLIPWFGDTPITDIKAADIETYMGEKLRRLSPRTVQYHHRVLSLALKRAEARGQVARNEARLVKPPVSKREEVHPLTREEVQKLLAATDGLEHTLYTVAAYMGLRMGEIIALRWTDISGTHLTVSRAVARVNGRAGIIPPKSKTSRRKLPMPGPVIDALRAHRTAQELEKASGRYKDQGLVFAGPQGQVLVGSTLGQMFTRRLRTLGIPHRRFHDLRHTCATFMLASGGNLDDVKRYLGHSTIMLTSDTYGHLEPSRQESVARWLSGWLSAVE